MDRIAVDKRVLARRFVRSLATYDRAAVVQAEMAARLIADLRLASGADRFDNVLELGCGTGLLTRQIVENCRPDRLVLNDLVAECERTARRFRRRKPEAIVRFVRGDMEAVEFPDGQDLIVSSAVLHWAADLRSLLKRLAGLLRPGGVLAMASFGPSNLRELAQVTGLSLHYWSMAEWRAALADDCDVLSGNESARTLWFPSAREILRHLKQTGVNALDSQPWSRPAIVRLCRAYESTFGQDGEVPLTYHPVFIVARKRSPAGKRE